MVSLRLSVDDKYLSIYMKNYSNRCQQWLERNTNIEAATLEKEIARFTSKLEALEQETNRVDEETLQDILSTLHLLEQRLLTDAAIENTNMNSNTGQQEATFTYNTEPLHPLNVEVESLDKETKRERLNNILTHTLIQQGTKDLKRNNS